MPAMSEILSVAGATTVVDDKDANPAPFKADLTNGFDALKGKGKKQDPFNIAIDYMDESRPYFIRIGKDGVLTALQKLDLELRNVMFFVKFSLNCVMTDWLVYLLRLVKSGFCRGRYGFSRLSELIRPWAYILHQSPVSWTGKEISPGNIGLINHGGLPKILTRPGRYPSFPFRNWWARSWGGTRECKALILSIIK